MKDIAASGKTVKKAALKVVRMRLLLIFRPVLGASSTALRE
jgi:hypothetical protein